MSWDSTMELFDNGASQLPQKKETVLPFIELAANYNNKLSAFNSYVILLLDSPLYESGATYEIRLKGKEKPIHRVICESKILYRFDKLSAFVARCDRGLPLDEYLKALLSEHRRLGPVENMTFALLLMVIVKEKQLRNSH